jgi:peptidoglycan recognition protein
MKLVRRSEWGAAPPKGKPRQIAAPVASLFLHHSVSPDGSDQRIRDIQRFHQQTQNWADVAYNWLYSPSSRLWYEGRGPGILGAHTRGHNKRSHAVCVLGNFEVERPAPHVVQDLADFARWHGTSWGPNRFQGHRDVGSTACPGKHLYGLIRDINLYAESDMTAADVQATREWVSKRVEHDYGSYEIWEEAIRQADV